MRRGTALAGSAIFLVIAPGTVMFLLPWWISRWHIGPPFFGLSLFRAIGALLIAAGLPVLLDSFARFAIQGFGTPAPVAPPTHLVVTGLYRYVRNPMYVAGVLIITGQALFFGNLRVLAYVFGVWLIFHLFVLLYEEPILHRKFGAQYDQYRINVRRWAPRLRPWKTNS